MHTTIAPPKRADAEANEESFDGFFAREYPRCVGIARRVLLDAHAAEDVAQEVFVAFLRRYDAASPFAAAWLHRATVHTALNAARGMRRRSQREAAHDALQRPLRASQEADADPLSVTLREERREAVRSALRRLPPRARAVLALRHGGLSYAETAAALAIKPSHVGTLLARAENALSKEISRASSR